MSIENNVISITITKQTAAVEQAGFGVTALVSEIGIANQPERFKLYGSLQDLLDAGVLSTDFTYKWASIHKGQTNPPPQFAVIRKEGAESYTVALDAVGADLSKFFYLAAESRVGADVQAVAAWAATNKKSFTGVLTDTDILTETAPNDMTPIAAASYPNVNIFYGSEPADPYFIDAGMTSIAAAAQLDSENGVIDWRYKTVIGVAAIDFSSAQLTALDNQNVGYYTNFGGSPSTFPTAADGSRSYIYVTDRWLEARSQEALIRVLKTYNIVGIDKFGLSHVQSALEGVASNGVLNGHLNPDVDPIITIPDPLLISSADKQAGLVNNVKMELVYRASIKKVVLEIILGF